tara:strand:+ start:871 stop:1023 length:153 start_codon:yes stop_codon:yes gene_type:complete
MLDAKFFLKVGPNVRDLYRKHIFTDGKHDHTEPFKGDKGIRYEEIEDTDA